MNENAMMDCIKAEPDVIREILDNREYASFAFYGRVPYSAIRDK